MNWFRKGIVYLLTLLFLGSLLGLAFSTSAYLNLAKPAKIESWLTKSKIYDKYVDFSLQEAEKNNDTTIVGAVSFKDPNLNKIAKEVFNVKLLQQNLNTAINSNYDWLNGKSTKPTFVIDLSQQKQEFADKVGQYVTDRLTGLQPCSSAQLEVLKNTDNIDPLSVPCLPNSINPEQEGLLVTEQLNSNTDFMDFTNISADSTNFETKGKAYYVSYSKAPQIYQAATKAPYAYAIFSILCLLGIIFIHPKRRNGVRIVGIATLVAGILLLIAKLVSDNSAATVNATLFKGSGLGVLEQPLIFVLREAETAISNVILWFGVVFVLTGFIILLLLLSTKNRGNKSRGTKPVTTGIPTKSSSSTSQNRQARNRQTTPAIDSSRFKGLEPTKTGADAPGPPRTPRKTPPSQTPKPKKPRLIQ